MGTVHIVQSVDRPLTAMDPARCTAPDLLEIQEELIRREPLFHRPKLGATREDFEAMTADAFRETGASGRRYRREFVIETVVERYSAPHDDPWTTEDFYYQQICADHYLLSYTLRQDTRVTRRATLWRQFEGRWEVVYHQGTIVEGGAADAAG